MSRFLLLFSIASLMANVNAQILKESEIPTAVKSKLAAMYPSAKIAKWEKENGIYSAEFKSNNAETAVLFELNGTHVQTQTEIPPSSLPANIAAFVKKTLGGKKIVEATKITHANGTITYETEIGHTDYLFDATGNFIRREADETEIDGDDDEDDDK